MTQRSFFLVSFTASFLAAFICLAGPAKSATRAIIFASDYAGAKPSLKLSNTKIDGNLIAESLRDSRVADVKLVIDATVVDWEREIGALLDRTAPKDIVLIYYAGHGLQVDGTNYFLASDGETLIAMDTILALIAEKAAATIMIVDACRNNPFQTDREVFLKVDDTLGGTRALTTVSMEYVSKGPKGLSQVGELRGMSAMVLFSTEPGNVAADGDPGKGSPFAKVAARELTKRASLNTVIRRISLAVNKATNGEQTPWRQGDLPFDVFIAGMANFPAP